MTYFMIETPNETYATFLENNVLNVCREDRHDYSIDICKKINAMPNVMEEIFRFSGDMTERTYKYTGMAIVGSRPIVFFEIDGENMSIYATDDYESEDGGVMANENYVSKVVDDVLDDCMRPQVVETRLTHPNDVHHQYVSYVMADDEFDDKSAMWAFAINSNGNMVFRKYDCEHLITRNNIKALFGKYKKHELGQIICSLYDFKMEVDTDKSFINLVLLHIVDMYKK